MIMLLGSRGRARGRSSSFVEKITSAVSSVFGGPTKVRRREDGRRGSVVPGWLALVGALACFVGGFFVGGKVAQTKGSAENQLRANGSSHPGFQGENETQPLSPDAFAVSAYPGMPAAEAMAKAKALAQYLREHKLDKARAYEGPQGWFVFVYWAGDAERRATKDRLQQLPEDVPDEWFCHYRKTAQDSGQDWPLAHRI